MLCLIIKGSILYFGPLLPSKFLISKELFEIAKLDTDVDAGWGF